MPILQEAFKSTESRKAFFAKLRKGMSKYTRGAYPASDFFEKTSRGLRYAGYEEGGKVKDVGMVRDLLPGTTDRLLRRLKTAKKIKEAPVAAVEPLRDWEIRSSRLSKSQRAVVDKIKAQLIKSKIVGETAPTVKVKGADGSLRDTGVLDISKRGKKKFRSVPKGQNKVTSLWTSMNPAQRARAMGLDPDIGGFTTRSWSELSPSEREYVTRSDKTEKFLSVALFGDKKKIKSHVRSALKSLQRPGSEELPVLKEFGIALNSRGGALSAFNKLLQRQAEGKSSEEEREAFMKKLLSQGWSGDEVKGFEQRAGFNTKFWRTVQKISVKKQRGTMTPKLASAAKDLGLKIRKSDFRNVGELAPESRYGTATEDAFNKAISQLRDKKKADRTKVLRQALQKGRALAAQRRKKRTKE